MKEIKLTQGQLAIVDDEDFDLVKDYRWYYHKGYAVRNDWKNHREIALHRVISNPEVNMVVDHINRNTLDNRRDNLRICTRAQNCQNHKKYVRHGRPTSSTYKGVSFNKISNQWHAYISANAQKRLVGSFRSERHAAMAYDIAARDLHKEFASLNFPSAITNIDS
jgi:hypothetical protein